LTSIYYGELVSKIGEFFLREIETGPMHKNRLWKSCLQNRVNTAGRTW